MDHALDPARSTGTRTSAPRARSQGASVTVEALADAGEQGSLNRAVTRAAEAVGAEIAIAIRDGSVIASGGRVTGGPARFDLLALAGTNEPGEGSRIGGRRGLGIGKST